MSERNASCCSPAVAQAVSTRLERSEASLVSCVFFFSIWSIKLCFKTNSRQPKLLSLTLAFCHLNLLILLSCERARSDVAFQSSFIDNPSITIEVWKQPCLLDDDDDE